MAAADTTYKVHLVYDMRGNATAGMKGLNAQARSTTAAFSGLKAAVGAAFGGAALALGKKYLYDYNNQVQKMKIGMAAIISMNFQAPFEAGAKAADKLHANLEKYAKVSIGTTADYVDMANAISSAVLRSGKGMKDLEEMTKGAVLVDSIMGTRKGDVSTDVSQMLSGILTNRDRVAKQLLAGIGEHDIGKFNKYAASKRADLTLKALSTTQLKDAGKAFGASTEGVMSTFQDNVQITFGKVGLPLVKAMTEEVKGWNKWIEANPAKIASIVERLSSGLKEAFAVLKDIAVEIGPIIKEAFGLVGGVLRFASEHREALISLLKAFMVFKGASIVGGGVMGIGNSVVGGVKAVGAAKTAFLGITSATGGTIAGLGTFATALGPAALAVGALGVAAWGAYKLATAKTQREKDAESGGKYHVAAQNYSLALTRRDQLKRQLSATGVDPTKDTSGLSDDLKKDVEELGAVTSGLKELNAVVMRQALESGHLKEQVTKGWGFNPSTKRLEPVTYRKLSLSDDSSSFTGSKNEAAAIRVGVRNAFYDAMKAGERVNYDPSGRTQETWTQSIFGGSERDLMKDLPPIKPTVNIGTVKVEVASDDPDRFVHGAMLAFGEVVRNPTSAADTIRGGF